MKRIVLDPDGWDFPGKLFALPDDPAYEPITDTDMAATELGLEKVRYAGMVGEIELGKVIWIDLEMHGAPRCSRPIRRVRVSRVVEYEGQVGGNLAKERGN